jgi:hypothetical protein
MSSVIFTSAGATSAAIAAPEMAIASPSPATADCRIALINFLHADVFCFAEP